MMNNEIAPPVKRPATSEAGRMRNGRRGTTYPRRSLHGQVAHEIGLRIVRGELAPGDILPNESDLSAELDVSRTTALREAFKVLAARGWSRQPRPARRAHPAAPGLEPARPRHPGPAVRRVAMEHFFRDLFKVRARSSSRPPRRSRRKQLPDDAEIARLPGDGRAADDDQPRTTDRRRPRPPGHPERHGQRAAGPRWDR
jgi:DNA-binding transcriptional MocR family regulator